MNRRMLALGRLKAGEMNKTEAAYAERLRALQAVGKVPSGEWLCARTGRSAVSSSPQRVRYLPSTCWLTCSVCHPQAPVCALSTATETGVFTTRTGACVCDGALCLDQPIRAGNLALRNRQEAACRL